MITVRPAGEPDAPALHGIALAAYQRYVPRIGREPAPMTENLAYYPRHGYTETHRAEQDGFHRVYFRKRLDG